VDRREKVLRGIDVSKLAGIEIGALAWPIVQKSEGDITYVDFTDAETLRKNHAGTHVPIEHIVEVDAIWGANTLQQAIGESRKVDYVIASHVVEHVPDLLGWLSELREVLKPGGQIRLVVPDKRFTFDRIRHETQAADVLSAHLVGARVPQPDRVLDFFLNRVTLDKQDAWDGAFGELTPVTTIPAALECALKSTRGEYVDVHCWVFTPRSMGLLFSRLAEDGMLDLECTHFEDTAYGEYEFFVGLRPSNERAAVLASWKRIAETARIDPDSKQKEIDGLKATLARVQAERDDALRKTGILEERVDKLMASTSWKVTSPLRAISRKLRNR
jgi:2-polyprenyl-3-methyl-5-hydroxy-6-metoxy-1,4-benzoquinol methylase